MRFSYIVLMISLIFLPEKLHAEDSQTVSAPGLFSYQAPKGWTVQDASISKYKVSFAPPENGFRANINVVTEKFSGSLQDYVALNKKAIKGSPMFVSVEVVDEKPFETTSGTKGVRVTIKDTLGKLNMQQVFYFFDGATCKFVVTASSLVGDGDKYAPLSMRP